MATKRPADGDEPPNKKVRVEDAQVSGQNDQERAVGITVFVSPNLPGFQCTVKTRYTDFLVNEILPSGDVLHLTDVATKNLKQANGRSAEVDGDAALTESKEMELKETAATAGAHDPSDAAADLPADQDVPEAENAKDDNDAGVTLSTEDKQSVVAIFGEDVSNKIIRLYSSILKNPKRKSRDLPTIKSHLIPDKSDRTEAHKVIRIVFQLKLQTETLQEEPGVIAIKVAPTKGAAGARGEHNQNGNHAKGKVGWNELGGEYLHFTLHKENKDTMEALGFIGSQLKIPAKNFEFAGTKDRRGVTVQKVAVFRVRAERIASLNRLARGWRIGGFEYKKHGLGLGDLTGNEFGLTLRDLRVPGDEGLDVAARLELAKTSVGEAAESFKSKGFLNYYGLQRFGSLSTGTHITGLKILQGDLGGAIDSILTYQPDLLPENVENSADKNKIPIDDITRADGIRRWREKNITPSELRDLIPRRFSAESSIMQYLMKKDRRSGKMIQEQDWQGALMTIQRGLRLMYVHAYQSLVWNMAAGKRWEHYGGKVVEGDLVIVGEKGEEEKSVGKDEVDESGEPIVRPHGDDAGPAKDTYTRARPLSKEEAESGKFDIFDVVLPQPGFDVLYPRNEVGEYYKEFMGSQAGGGLDPYNMRRAWKDASLSGGYRKVMARPLKGVTWDIVPYASIEEQLLETDLDKLRKAGEVDGSAQAGGSAIMEDAVVGNGHGGAEKDKLALVMRFQLGSSQYATMALRELTKGGAQAYKPEFNTSR
ncbi:multisubstrate pseudouridine synthase 7 [Recurvomyces mirabilis]|nr:multisubstrate pseudouridine synthase 7 [Recurvomyces mirabilis]